MTLSVEREKEKHNSGDQDSLVLGWNTGEILEYIRINGGISGIEVYVNGTPNPRSCILKPTLSHCVKLGILVGLPFTGPRYGFNYNDQALE